MPPKDTEPDPRLTALEQALIGLTNQFTELSAEAVAARKERDDLRAALADANAEHHRTVALLFDRHDRADRQLDEHHQTLNEHGAHLLHLVGSALKDRGESPLLSRLDSVERGLTAIYDRLLEVKQPIERSAPVDLASLGVTPAPVPDRVGAPVALPPVSAGWQQHDGSGTPLRTDSVVGIPNNPGQAGVGSGLLPPAPRAGSNWEQQPVPRGAGRQPN